MHKAHNIVSYILFDIVPNIILYIVFDTVPEIVCEKCDHVVPNIKSIFFLFIFLKITKILTSTFVWWLDVHLLVGRVT